MAICVNCGRPIKNREKTCSDTCKKAFNKKAVEEKHPIDFTHCQNPKCGKKIEHWVLYGKKWKFVHNRKYCSIVCANEHRSVIYTGRAKVVSKTRTPVKIEHNPDALCDPFIMKEECDA